MFLAMNSMAVTPVVSHAADAPGPELFLEPETFYRTALESLAEGVMILDAECRILYANKLVYDLTGYPPEELLGQTPGLLKADPNNSPCDSGPHPEEEPWHFEFEMKRKDG